MGDETPLVMWSVMRKIHSREAAYGAYWISDQFDIEGNHFFIVGAIDSIIN
jgi:hypothetical protein